MFQWIDQPEQISALCETLRAVTQQDNRLAVDTEFVRTNTYYSRPGLIQVGTADNIWLVDPVVLDDQQLKPLGDLLFDDSVQLLMHSASEDLEVFRNLWGRVPDNLFDTQIAASFCGFDRQTGLQRLLKTELDIDLAKEETRSDWLQRPLSPSQLHYAAEDVRYLHKLADTLLVRLQAKGRESWCQQEVATMIHRFNHRPADDELYLGFGAGWKFKPAQQAALRHLAAWREQTARSMNIPKTFIAKDAALYSLVEQQPKSKGRLSETGLQHSQIRKFGEDLLEQLSIGLQQPVPAILISRPLSKAHQRWYKHLRKVVTASAETTGLPADLLASKAQLIDYLNARLQGIPDPFTDNWRAPILLEGLDDSFESLSQASHPEEE